MTDYPFVDVRPTLRFTQPYWDALSEQERSEVLAHPTRAEIVSETPSSENRMAE